MKQSRVVLDMRAHLLLAFTWTALTVPTVLWWKDSILWVLMISIYANIIGHVSAYQAAKAEKHAGDDD